MSKLTLLTLLEDCRRVLREQTPTLQGADLRRRLDEQIAALSATGEEVRLCACGKPAFVWSAGAGLCRDCNLKQEEKTARRLGLTDE